MQSAYLSTTYLGPIQQYCKLLQYPVVYVETAENYLKQTYRNRCTIGDANGFLSLSIPIEKPAGVKCLTKDIRISDHGNWQHLHWNALISAYNASPFFEYYKDDFLPFYQKRFDFLFDFNEELRTLVCSLLDLEVTVIYTDSYTLEAQNDYREIIRPKQAGEDKGFKAKPYYQVFGNKFGFQPNLSIVDLLFNMGPEGILVLKDSIPEQNPCYSF